ncbi:MAG TPA: histidine kinase [Saprospiraceae bacterium]|nr:histidine kinase [Saprospiraceae bacterium]
MIHIAHIQQDQSRFEEAAHHLLQALDITHSLDWNERTTDLYSFLSRCHAQSGQWRQAHEYARRAADMKSYLLNENRLQALHELQIQYHTAETEKELALAENENLLREKQLSKSYGAIAALGLGLLLASLLAWNFRQKKIMAQLLTDQNLAKHEQELRQLAQEREAAALMSLFIGQEQERRRVANELHDSLGGLLYAMQLQLSEPNATGVDWQHLLQQAIAENRRISQNLMPPTLSRLGLCPALREWKTQFEQTWSLPLHLDLPESEIKLPDAVSVAVFRMAQELIINAAKHAQASRIALHLHPAPGSLTLMVEDDGQGFDATALPPGFLKTVYSRAHIIGATVHIDSSPGRGATFILEIPWIGEETQITQ